MGPWLGSEEGPASGRPTLGEEEGLVMAPLLHREPGAGGHQRPSAFLGAFTCYSLPDTSQLAGHMGLSQEATHAFSIWV